MSSSTTPVDQVWLGHSGPSITSFLREYGVKQVTYVLDATAPQKHAEYVESDGRRFQELGFGLKILNKKDPLESVLTAEALVVSGGNTWMLAEAMHRYGLVEAIRARIEAGMPYMGWSAGAIFAAPTIQGTNDWCVSSSETVRLEGLNVFPLNINPHYRDPVLLSNEAKRQHADLLATLYASVPGLQEELENQGETRVERIEEMVQATGRGVVGLKEGAILRIHGHDVTLEGTAGAVLYLPGKEPQTFEPGAQMNLAECE